MTRTDRAGRRPPGPAATTPFALFPGEPPAHRFGSGDLLRNTHNRVDSDSRATVVRQRACRHRNGEPHESREQEHRGCGGPRGCGSRHGRHGRRKPCSAPRRRRPGRPAWRAADLHVVAAAPRRAGRARAPGADVRPGARPAPALARRARPCAWASSPCASKSCRAPPRPWSTPSRRRAWPSGAPTPSTAARCWSASTDAGDELLARLGRARRASAEALFARLDGAQCEQLLELLAILNERDAAPRRPGAPS